MIDYVLVEKVMKKLKDRREDSHKGDNGVVVFIGGSEIYTGAALLACKAALLTGVDLVIACVPEKVGWILNSYCPEVVCVKLKGKNITKSHENTILDFVLRADAVLIGNGVISDSFDIIKKITMKIRKNLVIDGGGLRAIDIKTIKHLTNSILTPHKDELRNILSNSGREALIHYSSSNILNSLQNILGTNTLLLKGHIDYIVNSSRILSNKIHNKYMTKGGTGDILSGLSAGFLAITKESYASAVTATYINGLAGNEALKKRGPSFISSDIFNEIPEIMKRLIKSL